MRPPTTSANPLGWLVDGMASLWGERGAGSHVGVRRAMEREGREREEVCSTRFDTGKSEG